MTYSQHILDWLSWQLHPGATLTQLIADPSLVTRIAVRASRPVPPFVVTTLT